MPNSNNAIYPASGVQTKIFPTSPLGVVSKFDPVGKYREEEEIPNEDGTLTYVVGVDFMNEVDVEIVMYPNQNVPAPLTNLNFNNGSANTSYLIRGDVKIAGNAGKAKRIVFKCINNSSLP
jgi:hypothetical protein